MTEPHPHDNAPTAGRAVAKLTEIVETQQETIDMLVTAVAHLRGDPGTDGTFGTPSPGEGPRPEHFRWRDLDRTAASEAWHRLISWVGWLVEHYQLWETVPECWPEHWPHIQELSALYLAWWDAYIRP